MAVTTVDSARAQRAREMENALASVWMEGLEPSPEALAIFQRYVDGEMTAEEMGFAIDQLLDSKYGPVGNSSAHFRGCVRAGRRIPHCEHFEIG
jgi:hypothetical protein